MEVEYGSDNPLSLGANVINLTVLQSKPTVKYSKAGNKQYELVMVDYDKMKIGDEEDWKLWHVKNIPGDDLKNGQLDEGTVETEYKSVTRENPRNLLHHYLFLIYEMKEGDENENVGDRVLGCCPVAGNFFRLVMDASQTVKYRMDLLQDFVNTNNDLNNDLEEKLKDIIASMKQLKGKIDFVKNFINHPCQVWLQINENCDEILALVAGVDVRSNEKLRKILDIQYLKSAMQESKTQYNFCLGKSKVII